MKVLLVEDDAKLSRFLTRVLEEESFLVEACASGRAALDAFEAGRPDVIILDWMLPDCDGLDVCREVRQRSVDVPVLMLTARGELADKVNGLDAGADDYMAKPFEIEELLARIRALVRRLSLRRILVGSLRIDLERRRVWTDKAPVELTPREFDLLFHLARRNGEAVSRAVLLAEVWGVELDPGTNVVEVHVSRLRNKLGAEAWRLETLRREGYRLNREAPA